MRVPFLLGHPLDKAIGMKKSEQIRMLFRCQRNACLRAAIKKGFAKGIADLNKELENLNTERKYSKKC